jgi:inorganic pyrophosphatase
MTAIERPCSLPLNEALDARSKPIWRAVDHTEENRTNRRLPYPGVVTDLFALPAFVDAHSIHVIIESPRGSTSKFKYDSTRGVMMLSRPLTLGLSYPYDWGFVPSTRVADGDPLDAIVLWDGRSYPGVVLACRPIGVLSVEQSNLTSQRRERNDRLLALPTKVPRLENIRTVFDLSERIRRELEQFFLNVVAFEGKDLTVLGWDGPDEALALVRASGTASMYEPADEAN